MECSKARGRNANKVVLYEDAAKKQLQEFISALRGCDIMATAICSLGANLENVESQQLHHLLTPGIICFLCLYLLICIISIVLQWCKHVHYSLFSKILLSHFLFCAGKGLSNVNSVLKHFKDGFDWVEANSSGRIIPREGVDNEYDSACGKVKEIESHFTMYLKEQRKLLGDKSVRMSKRRFGNIWSF